MDEQVLSGFVAPRAVIAVAGDLAIDKTRVEGADRFVAKADLFDDSGTKVLNHHIGAGEERTNLSEIGRVL